ncbi:hypothetical protein ACTXT7_001299 [Hymenolepis weldensis]
MSLVYMEREAQAISLKFVEFATLPRPSNKIWSALEPSEKCGRANDRESSNHGCAYRDVPAIKRNIFTDSRTK